MKTKTLILVIAAGLMGVGGAAGCHTAHVDKPLTAELGNSDPDTQLEFWHTLAERNLTSNDEAFHGVLLYLKDADPATDYAGRVNALKKRGLLDANFNEPADQAIERGTLAQVLVRMLKIKGGMFQRLTHDHPRYAVRELMYMDLYPPSSPNQTFSGTEFLGIIGRIEDYQRGNPANYPASILPGEHQPGQEGANAKPREAVTQPTTRPAPQPTVRPTK